MSQSIIPFIIVSFQNATVSQEVLYTVAASDLDDKENGQLQFTLQNYESVFSIHPTNGEIMLIMPLDYDGSDIEYQLSIEVTDLAPDETVRLTDQATLNILVQDINDNDPVFTEVREPFKLTIISYVYGAM